VVQSALTFSVAASALVSVIEPAKDDQGSTQGGNGTEDTTASTPQGNGTAASSHDKAQNGYQKNDIRLKISDLSPRKPDPPLSPAPFQSVPLALNPPIALAPVKRPTHAQGSSSQLVQASDDMVLQISPPYRPSLHKAIVMVYLWCVCADSVHALFLPLAIHSTRIGNFKSHLRVGSRACQGARSVASKFPYKSEADFALSVTNSGSSDAR